MKIFVQCCLCFVALNLVFGVVVQSPIIIIVSAIAVIGISYSINKLHN